MIMFWTTSNDFFHINCSNRFFSLAIVLLLLASSTWSLVFNSQWRQALYTSFEEVFPCTPTGVREDTCQPPRELTITYFDVGQGLAHLIQIPSGKVILYDAGVGGFICILNESEFEVGEVLDPGMIHPTSTYKSFLELIKSREISYRIVRDGNILDWGPDVFVQVLSPPPDSLWKCANENSITIMLIYGKIRFLFTGDIEKDAINRLINEYGPRIRADVVQVPHHTHQSGNITIVSDGKNIRIKTVR